MAGPTDAFDIAFNRVRVTVEDGFADLVQDRVVELKANIGAQVLELFEDIALAFGGDTVPAEISGYTDWSDLTANWVKRKFSRGVLRARAQKDQRERQEAKKLGVPWRKIEFNRFYVGRHAAMQRALLGKAGKFVYGEPEVLTGSGLARGFRVDGAGRLRVARGFAGAGRFAARASALRVTLTITPFPQLPDDPTSIFSGKLGVKVGAGEYGADNRPSRPFLGPFIRYYTEVKVPQVIERTIQL